MGQQEKEQQGIKREQTENPKKLKGNDRPGS